MYELAQWAEHVHIILSPNIVSTSMDRWQSHQTTVSPGGMNAVKTAGANTPIISVMESREQEYGMMAAKRRPHVSPWQFIVHPAKSSALIVIVW